MQRFGYTVCGGPSYACGVNLTFGEGCQRRPADLFRLLMNSPGHGANILGEGFREIGTGDVTGTYEWYKGLSMPTAGFGAHSRVA